jgi:glucose-6-phosphate 1-dehydrogenase
VNETQASVQPWCAGEQASGAKPAPPCTVVIFGAGGDLTQRLLVPALYNLSCWGLLPDQLAIIGIGRTLRGADVFRDEVAEAAKKFTHGSIDPKALQPITRNVDQMAGDVRDKATYAALRERLDKLAPTVGRNVLFYLAIAPQFFGEIVQQLGAAGLLREDEGAWRRVIIEKPFGHDLASARALDNQIHAVVGEEQIYRIDHFLGKETVQSILAVRFANSIFEPIWNRDHIDHVQITVAETVGVEQRGNFYEGVGALRDMIPNHLFQLLTMTAMEPPISFDADAVRGRKEDVLLSVRPLSPEDARRYAVRAQYAAGTSTGQNVPAYRDEARVAKDSVTETYAAMRLMLDNWRWSGVPFYLRTGKRLARRTTEIAIRFKPAPYLLFRDTPVDRVLADWMVLRIQPDEGIALEFNAKVPGPHVQLDRVVMDLMYKDYFNVSPSTGYETLIYDCMIGDAMLFQRADNIEAGWQVVQPILDAWASPDAPLHFYPAGSEGPQEAADLLQQDGRAWRPIGRANR